MHAINRLTRHHAVATTIKFKKSNFIKLQKLEGTGYSALPSPPRLLRHAACSRGSADTHTDGRRATQYLLRWLSFIALIAASHLQLRLIR